jgi:hypothetical protein
MIGCVLLAFALCNPNTPYGGYAYVQPQPYYAQQQATVYAQPQGYGPNGQVYAQPQPYYAPPPVVYAQAYPVPAVIPWVFWNGGWGWWHGGRWFGNGWGGHFHGGHR